MPNWRETKRELIDPLYKLQADGGILFLTRFFRMFSYGALSVVLYLYLRELDFSEIEIGILFTGTLLGDLLITFLLTTMADDFGRQKTLIVGGLLKLFAGICFSFFTSFAPLLIAGIVGVVTPTGLSVPL